MKAEVSQAALRRRAVWPLINSQAEAPLPLRAPTRLPGGRLLGRQQHSAAHLIKLLGAAVIATDCGPILVQRPYSFCRGAQGDQLRQNQAKMNAWATVNKPKSKLQ